MPFDQKVQLWMVVGTWVAGLATLVAAAVALHLARRSEKVSLRIFVGDRLVMRGDGSPGEPYMCFNVTNVGERPVVINTVGWVIGKRKARRYGIQILEGPPWKQCPAELTHGQGAQFMVGLSGTPDWTKDFATNFVKEPQQLKTLRAQIFTSVGQIFEIKPEHSLIDRLRRVTEGMAQSDA